MSVVILGCQLVRREFGVPPPALLPFFGLVALGVLQLVPLPALLHGALAPGSAALWHPQDPTAASVLGAGWRPISLRPTATLESVTLGIGLLSLVALAGPAMKRRRGRRVSIVSVVLGGLTVAAYGVVARVAFGPLLYGRFVVPTVSPFGPFVSKNHFAGYVGMVALLALGLATAMVKRERGNASALSWVTRSRADRALLAFGAAATMALSVFVSQSRGGALALLAGSVAFWRLRSRGAPLGRRGVFAAACVGAVVVGMWTTLPPDAKQRLAGILGRPDASGHYRLGVWRDTLSAFRHSPWWGQGIGVFEDALPRFKTVAGQLRVEHAENELLELLVEGGLVASLLAGLAVAVVARSLLRRAQDQHAHPTKGEVAGAAAGLAALLTHSLFDFSLRVPATLTLAAFLLAVVLASQFDEGGDASRAPGVIALLVLTSALACAVRSASDATSGNLAQLSTLAIRAPIQPARLHLIEQALMSIVRKRPGAADVWAHLAWLRALRGERSDAAALADYAAGLDPLRPGLREYAERLSQAASLPH